MNIKTVLISIAAVAVLGVGAWWFTQDDSDGGTDANQAAQMQDASISQLLAQNQDQVCTYDTVDQQGNNNSGTVYFSDGRMSGDFSLAAPGEDAMLSHVINDGQSQYFWEEGQTEGYKLSIDQSPTTPEGSESDEQVSNINQDEDFEFNCDGWSVDESRFMPPGNVDFIDYSAQIEQAQNEASEALEQACAALEDAAQRAACESGL